MALLALLRQGARYGLDMLKALREDAGMDVSEGSIYPILHRLAKAGFVAADWRHDAGATHPRKYYALTDTGRATLASMEREWADLAANLHALIGSSTS